MSQAIQETAVVDVTSAWTSKINITQAVAAAAMVLTLFTGGKFGLTPDQQSALVVSIGVFGNLTTYIMKTFFTSTVHQASLPAK